MTTATRVDDLGAPVRFIKAIPRFAPPGGLQPCKSNPVRFVRLWAPLILTKSLAIAGLFVFCSMTTATRVGELGAPRTIYQSRPSIAPSGGIQPYKSDPVRFVRLWAPLFQKPV